MKDNNPYNSQDFAELLFVVISTFLINALVILAFDRKGDRRNG